MNRRFIPWLGLAFVLSLVISSAASAATQDEVFRSINQSMGQQTDFSKIIPWLAVVGGLIAITVYFNRRQNRKVLPKILRHQGKLLREVTRNLDLTGGELKQLKILAEEQECQSPLTLLLCPSLLKKAGRESTRADRKTVVELAAKYDPKAK